MVQVHVNLRELTRGREISLMRPLLRMDFPLPLQSKLNRRVCRLEESEDRETPQEAILLGLEAYLRIFTSCVFLFLSRCELELLWNWEPTDSSEAQTLKQIEFP